MSKFQKNEFMKENDFNAKDEFLFYYSLDKHVFNFLLSTLFPKMEYLKEIMEKGVKKLVEAREILIKSVYDVFVCHLTIMKSLNNSQVDIVKIFCEALNNQSSSMSPFEIWSMKKEEVSYQYDMTKDTHFGKIVKRKIPEGEDSIINIQHETWTMP
mmetsp:Transcript_9664/g.8509  ORF Transcript_9664/g.8509 Transcript_9664/m.8509 type:complete len:156 (+) Transcript_9664:735-1202(+)